jgi:hypothetical protein
MKCVSSTQIFIEQFVLSIYRSLDETDVFGKISYDNAVSIMISIIDG